MPQFAAPRTVRAEDLSTGAWLIATGLFKKIVIADNLSPLVDTVFAPDFRASGGDVLLASYAFALQIYGDFAGYSDMARGLSQLFGIELNVNFRFPYAVTNPREFWRHWHISLSTWLRDYLYKPLGGSRGGTWATNRNLLVTMVLGGLWHGAAWSFVLWGAYQGLWLVAHRGYESWRGVRTAPPLARDRRVARHDPSGVLRLAAVPRPLVRPDSDDDIGARHRLADQRRRGGVGLGAGRLRAAAGAAARLRMVEGRSAGRAEAAAGPALRRLRRGVLPDPAVRVVRRRPVHLLQF